MGDKPAGNPTTSTQPGRQKTMKRTGRQMKRSGGTNEWKWETHEKKWETNESGRQASREPDHKHPAWETNEKNWETNERKWETSRPGTRPDHPAPRRPFFKALRTPNSKLFGEKCPSRSLRTRKSFKSWIHSVSNTLEIWGKRVRMTFHDVSTTCGQSDIYDLFCIALHIR